MKQEQDESTALPAEAGSEEKLPLIELETLLRRPPSRRKRLIQFGVVVAVLTALVVVFWGDVIPRHPMPATLPPPPTVLIISSNVSEGTIQVNQQQQHGTFPMRVTLQGLASQVTLAAPPFRSIACHLEPPQPVTPPAAEIFQPCLLRRGTLTPPRGGPTNPAIYLTMLLTSEDLPSGQQQQLKTLLAQIASFQQELIVPDGAYYATAVTADGKITSQRATAALQAAVILAPSDPSPFQTGWNCQGALCYGSAMLTNSPTSEMWVIEVPVILRWRFAATPAPNSSEVVYGPQGHISMPLSYTSAAGWQLAQQEEPGIATQVSGQVCGIGVQLLGRQLTDGGWNLTSTEQFGVSGCTLDVQQTTTDQGHFLWRFGVLLAVDAKAHATLPDLPVAPPEEVAAP